MALNAPYGYVDMGPCIELAELLGDGQGLAE
jgi:hypothetical protein